MRRKAVAYELLSLDGVAEEPSQFIAEFDEFMSENLGRVIATQDVVLMGRRTYDECAVFWPSSDIEPFATFINGVEKYVVTSTTPEVTWANSTMVGGDLSGAIADLKHGSDSDIGVHGSIELSHALLESGLIDELRLVVVPALQGQGRRLFNSATPSSLTLVRSIVSPSGSLLLDYELTH